MEVTYDDFKKVQIKVGTVLEVKKNEKARKPSLVVKVDFGEEIGIKQSSAQITHYYNEESLKGKQIIGVCNFAEKNITADASIENILIYAMFPEIGLNFIENSDNPDYFESEPLDITQLTDSSYLVTVEDQEYSVTLKPDNSIFLMDLRGSVSHISVICYFFLSSK